MLKRHYHRHKKPNRPKSPKVKKEAYGVYLQKTVEQFNQKSKPAILSHYKHQQLMMQHEYPSLCFKAMLSDMIKTQDESVQVEQLKDLISYLLTHRKKIYLAEFDPNELIQFVQLMMFSSDSYIKKKRKQAISLLFKKKGFKNEDDVLYLFCVAYQSGNPKIFRDLLDHKNIFSSTKLFKLQKAFFPEDGSHLRCLDLFYRLDPRQYRNRKWLHLTTYEKLYFLIGEFFNIKKLSHRLALEGEVQIKWRDKSLKFQEFYFVNDSIELEGQMDGRSLIQFKEALLMFQVKYHGPEKKLLNQAVEHILKIEPRSEHRFRHKLHDGKDHAYLFSLDEHLTAAFHTQGGRLYQINLGEGCGDFPGIHIYEVTQAQRKDVHCHLTTLQYPDHLTKHFSRLPSNRGLKKLGYQELPEQLSGNCTYESVKGLFLAILFDRCQAKYPLKQAYKQALDIYRLFLEFDAKDALKDYQTHTLSSNKALLANARKRFEHFMKEQVYEDDYFCYYIEGNEENEPLFHDFPKKPSIPKN